MYAQPGLHPIKMEKILLLYACIASTQMIFATLTVKVESPENALLIGDNLTMMCSVKERISKCKWQLLSLDGLTVINITLKSEADLPEGIVYHGRGFQNGECGITILYVTEKHNGLLTCGLFPESDINSDGMYKNATVVVAKAPRTPQIKVTRMYPVNDSYSENTFDEDKNIRAECRIEFGRPKAKISWFIENKPINFLKLHPREVIDAGPKNGFWKTVTQNLTTTLKYKHNGKYLRCVADHVAFGQGTVTHKNYKLNVLFSPRLKNKNTKQCGLAAGKKGKILVGIEANPKPEIKWLIDGEKVTEGGSDASGRFKAANLTKSGKATHKWNAVLKIHKVEFTDVHKTFTLSARNIRGEKEYTVKISACTSSFG